MNLEEQLRLALRREDPGPDFTAQVLARTSPKPLVAVRRTWVSWMAALAASLLLMAGALAYRQYQGERAKSQVLLAMRIAASKLNKAQKKVQMLNHRGNS
jgi:hypothetical protein